MADEEAAAQELENNNGDQAAATAVAPVIKPASPTRKPKQLPPYRVLLHNDPVNTFEHVIQAIVQLTPLNVEDAIERTVEAHESGLSLLLVTHKERAELYAEQFTSLKLNISIEPAEE